MPEVIYGKAIPFPYDNVDTDQIIPAQFLKLLYKKGLGKYLFYRWRYDEKGNERPDFVLNDTKFKDGSILVAKKNFGIGSSRENAVWALVDYGIKAVLAESFGDIFYGNSVKNGLACIKLPSEALDKIINLAYSGNLYLTIDFKKKQVLYEGVSVPFEIDEYSRKRLISGENEIEYTLKNYSDKIAEHEKNMKNFMKSNLNDVIRTLVEG